MNCNEFENLITEYLENTASPLQRRQMESHLSECEKCRALESRERSVMEQLCALPIEKCPDKVIDQVMETIREPRMSLSECIRTWLRIEPLWRYGLASLAGAIFIALLTMLLYAPNQNKQIMKQVEFTTEEIQQAKAEAELALAYFAVYSRKMEPALEEIEIAEPIIKSIELKIKKALIKVPYI